MQYGYDFVTMRAFRLIRLLRLLKLGRYAHSLRTLGAALRMKREELSVIGVSVAFLLVVISSLMYVVEREAPPRVFSSIPATMWWGVTTLTTIGYGDVYPVTPLGRLLGGAIAPTTIGIVALPAGVLASGLAAVVEERRRPLTARENDGPDIVRCPRCGTCYSPGSGAAGSSATSAQATQVGDAA